jgi:hypothetical protein
MVVASIVDALPGVSITVQWRRWKWHGRPNRVAAAKGEVPSARLLARSPNSYYGRRRAVVRDIHMAARLGHP